jgi:20S proteasome alpha/beta subunit
MLRLYWLILIISTCFSTFLCDYGGNIQFNPQGSLQQLELAQKLVRQRGGPLCAIIGKDESIMVLSARPNRKSPLHLTDLQKVFILKGNILFALTGSLSSGKQFVVIAKQLIDQHYISFGNFISIEEFVEKLANIIHSASIVEGQSIPAVNILVAGSDQTKRSCIFTIDCDGSFQSWKAVALGKDSNLAMNILSDSIDETNLSTASSETSKVQYDTLMRKLHDQGVFDGTFDNILHTENPSDSGFNLNNPWEVEVMIMHD